MTEELKYDSIAALAAAAEEAGGPISALVLRQQARQLEKDEAQVFAQMRDTYAVMAACIEPGCDEQLRSASGLSGGSAFRMRRAVADGKNLTGGVLGGALYRALAVSELNAAMGRVVAAPTAGSCGILPAAVLTMQMEKTSVRVKTDEAGKIKLENLVINYYLSFSKSGYRTKVVKLDENKPVIDVTLNPKK